MIKYRNEYSKRHSWAQLFFFSRSAPAGKRHLMPPWNNSCVLSRGVPHEIKEVVLLMHKLGTASSSGDEFDIGSRFLLLIAEHVCEYSWYEVRTASQGVEVS